MECNGTRKFDEAVAGEADSCIRQALPLPSVLNSPLTTQLVCIHTPFSPPATTSVCVCVCVCRAVDKVHPLLAFSLDNVLEEVHVHLSVQVAHTVDSLNQRRGERRILQSLFQCALPRVVNANRAVRFWVCAHTWKRHPATLFQLPGLAVLGRVAAHGVEDGDCATYGNKMYRCSPRVGCAVLELPTPLSKRKWCTNGMCIQPHANKAYNARSLHG
jgi:hypothetical protein